jgi:hypothetical protein
MANQNHLKQSDPERSQGPTQIEVCSNGAFFQAWYTIHIQRQCKNEKNIL